MATGTPATALLSRLGLAFTLHPSQLGFIGADERYRVEPGLFDVWLAPHAQGGSTATFRLVGPPSVSDGR